jgi:hypothetical protein
MIVSLSAGFGRVLTLPLLRSINQFGFHCVRQCIPLGAPEDYVMRLVREVARAKMKGCFEVGGWGRWNKQDYAVYWDRSAPNILEASNQGSLVSTLMDYYGCDGFIECGNEPDGTKNLSPEKFVDLVNSMLHSIRWVSPWRKVITGGVSNLVGDEGLGYLREAIKRGLPTGKTFDDVLVGIHPYRTHQEPWKKHDGETIGSLARMIAEEAGPFAVTESGWHSAPQKKGCFLCPTKYEFTHEEIQAFAKWELDHWYSYGAKLYNWYQLNDGPKRHINEDNYGITYFGTGLPKPVVKSFQDWKP